MAKEPPPLGMILGDLVARIPAGLRRLTLAPWRPHRTFDGRLEAVADLHERLNELHERSVAADAPQMVRLFNDRVQRVIIESGRRPTMAIVRQLLETTCELADQNDLAFDLPAFDAQLVSNPAYAVPLRRRLLEVEPRLLHEDLILREFGASLALIVSAFVQALPETALWPEGTDTDPPSPLLTVPALALIPDARALVLEIITIVGLAPIDDHPAQVLALEATRDQIVRNTLEASGLTLEHAKAHPSRMVFAGDADLSPLDLAETYLAETPLLALLKTPVPFAIPHARRFEHTHILGGTGHGKTQLLQTMILADLDDPVRPAVVAIDSQGDMIRTLSQLARFDPALDDRLVILDPADTEWPLALNLFDINRARLNRLSLGQREQMLAGIITLYDYIFGALLGAELTQKQGVVFRYLARLMIEIPEANIQTLRELMEDAAPFRPYIARLSGTTRAFFEKEFEDRSFIATRQQIRRRLYGILSNPTFERMFSHPKSAFDMKAALDAGKVVLINTAKDVLKEEASATFGRFMIALVEQAALERAAEPEASRRPAFVYVDEAAAYFDQTIDTLLIQARKYNVGLTLAHQYLDQLSSQLRASVMTNPASRFVGGISDRDAHALDADMRTSTSFLLATRKRARETDFACFVRNMTPEAIRLSLPLGTVEREPRMSREAYGHLLSRVRAEVATPLADVLAGIDRHGVPGPSGEGDFADRY